MNELKVLNEQEVLGKQFRVYGTAEEPLFVANDVADWIEHSNVTEMLRGIDDDEKLVSTILRAGQNRQMNLLMLSGQMVDGIDTVKAKDVDMTGNPVYYPKTDGTEIYKKQLQADGKSRIFVYRLLNPDEQQQPKAEEKPIDIEAMFNQLRNDVCSEISEIKNMFPTQMSVTPEAKQQNGGKQR